jgi:uncharacterized membrane protein
MIALLRALAVLTVPVMSHLAVTFQLPLLRVIAVLLLVAVLLANQLRKPLGWLLLIATAVLLFSLPAIAIFISAIFPTLLLALFAGAFASSLRVGRTPLIVAFATAIRNEVLPPEIERYCRLATWYWAISLISLAVINLLLAAFASPIAWSAVANIGNYIILALLFIVEFLARYVCLRQFDHPSLPEFIAAIRQINFREMMQ